MHAENIVLDKNISSDFSKHLLKMFDAVLLRV